MGRITIVLRLALGDLRRRPAELALLLLAMSAATTTLTLGLVVRAAASDPYLATREATRGPDVVAAAQPWSSVDADRPVDLRFDHPADPADLTALLDEPGVVAGGGPYPVVATELTTDGGVWDVQAVGRDTGPATVDQPLVVDGGWVSGGGMVVVEAAFAAELDLEVGDSVTLGGRPFEVVGTAVSAVMAPFPDVSCFSPCAVGMPRERWDEISPVLLRDPGLVWIADTDASGLVSDPFALSYTASLELADADDAAAFIADHPPTARDSLALWGWDDVVTVATDSAGDAQIVLVSGAWLLALLAVASISVLVGGRMADQTRRVGLLKAIGGTPGLVAAVLLTQYAVVALVAAGLGLVAGSALAPLLTRQSAGALGRVAAPPLTSVTVAVVAGVALTVAVGATVVPALRAARTSTVRALADAPRPPRRSPWLIGLSAALPVPLLLAVRIAARRPRRAVLTALTVAISISGTVVALTVAAELERQRSGGSLRAGQAVFLSHVLLLVTLLILSLAAVNALFITWATVADNRHHAALTRALGTTPGQVGMALAAAQVLPALVGTLLGIFPGSYLLYSVINLANDNGRDATYPPLWQLAAVVVLTTVVMAGLVAVPARLAGRRPPAPVLRSELA